MSSVRVAVRVRPVNTREEQLSSKVIVGVIGNAISIQKPSTRGEKMKEGKVFSFDLAYDSTDRESSTYASQEQIFQDLGSHVLSSAFEGFNACMFAYGQTGSGKSYTMMGLKDDKGLIPRICEGLFSKMSQRCKEDAVSFHTDVSYLEIYNERVQDLLRKPSANGLGLKVREHPRNGPYVENLSKYAVHSHSDMEDLIALGNTSRTVASTGMNDVSSRSHAIFTIVFTQAWLDAEIPRELISKIHLVDLAGSERADSTNSKGIRLKEGANINKSLVTLGSVISALADQGCSGKSTKKKQVFIPYRDSVLTWLLKDSLGGNSITTMIAAISPAEVNYEETLSTLRYASRAKNIMNTPTVNEDDSVKVIRELQAEVARLQTLLAEATQGSYPEFSSCVKVEEKLHQREAKVNHKGCFQELAVDATPTSPAVCQVVALKKEWTYRWSETQSILQEETVALRIEPSEVVLNCQLPHLVLMGVDEDLLSSGIILYHLKEGRTWIGSNEAFHSLDIVLRGTGVLDEHCVFENSAGTVTLLPQDGASCSVNGSVVTGPCQLTQGCIIHLGRATLLRFNYPKEASQLRWKRQSTRLSGSSLSLTDGSKSSENLSKTTLQNSGQVGLWIQSLLPSICLTSTPEKKVIDAANSERDPVPPDVGFELDGETLQGEVGTGDGLEQDGDLCHKSGLGLVSERPQRRAQSGAEVASLNGEEVWSGNASLQQTSVLGPGDGCGRKPEGDANEIQGPVTPCFKERPGSGGSSLGSKSLLQGICNSGVRLVLQQTSTLLDSKTCSSQVACCQRCDAAFHDQFSLEEMDESGGLEEFPAVCLAETPPAAIQTSRLGSLFSKVSFVVQDAKRRLFNSPTIVRQVTEVRLLTFGARWSSQVISLVKESNVLSVVRDSQIFSMVGGSFALSLFMESPVFSVVKELPLVQLIQPKMDPILQYVKAAGLTKDSDNLLSHSSLSTHSTVVKPPTDVQQPLTESSGDFKTTKEVEEDIRMKQEDKNKSQLQNQICKTKLRQKFRDRNQTLESPLTFRFAIQTLIRYPDPFLALQTLPLKDVMSSVQSVLFPSACKPLRPVALHWLCVATCSQPEVQPALLLLMENDVYTLTAESSHLALFHHLPLVQLKEMHVGLAGQSLRLMGTTVESILAVYTYNQKHTKELCAAILDVVSPGERRVSHHPLLHEDLMKISIERQVHVPDLLLDSGLRVCCQFQKSLADLVYVLHCNTDQKNVTLGETKLLMYTSAAVHISSRGQGEHVAQFFLTDTHFGALRADAVFYPTPQLVNLSSCHPQFHDFTIRRISDVRCMLVHNEDESGSVRLDIIFANAGARGHPESTGKTATPSEHTLNSSLPAEVWKLTFSCSTEAARLINHLSNV